MANDHSDDHDEGFPKRDHDGGGPFIGEAVKKLVTAGISAAFMTEESIRGFVSELKLPKETLNLLLQGASKSKEELMNRVSRELIGMVNKIDLVKEVSRFMEEHKFKVSAEIEIIKKDGSSEVSEQSK